MGPLLSWYYHNMLVETTCVNFGKKILLQIAKGSCNKSIHTKCIYLFIKKNKVNIIY